MRAQATCLVSPLSRQDRRRRLVGRKRVEVVQGSGGQRPPARRPGRGGHLARPPGPALRLPGPGHHGRHGGARLPGPGQVRRAAGTRPEVLRLPTPPRHATAEREAPQTSVAPQDPANPQPAAAPQAMSPSRPEPGSWSRYPAGPAFLTALAEGRLVRAAWSALPGPEWPAEIAIAAATTAAAGAGAVIVVPDARDLARVDAALTALNQGTG